MQAARLLGLGEEDAAAADAEGVVRRLGRARDLDWLFVDDGLEDFGQAGFVGDIPVERLEPGIEEFKAELLLFVRGPEDLAVLLEPLDEFDDRRGGRHSHCASEYCRAGVKSSRRERANSLRRTAYSRRQG